MSNEVKQLVDDLNRDFNEFKKQNDAKNDATANNLNAAITKTQEKLEQVETALNRAAAVNKAGEVSEMLSSKAGLKMLAQMSKNDDSFRKFVSEGAVGKAWATGDYAAKGTVGQTGVGADGGYSIPTLIDQLVDMMIIESSPIESLATSITIGQQDGYHGLIDNNDASAGWVTETGTRTGTNANTFTRVDILTYELYANPQLTLRLIEDAPYGAEGELMKALGKVLARVRATAFVNGAGSGSNQPSGFLTYTANDITTGGTPGVQNLNTVTSATSGVISADDVFSLVYSLRDGYQQNGAFAANRLVYEVIRKFKDSYGQYLWVPNIAAGQPSTLAGFPVYQFADMPSTVAAGNLVLTFADWSEFYKIVNRVGMQMLRDPYSVEGNVVFKTRQRVGGGIFNGVAGSTLKVHT